MAKKQTTTAKKPAARARPKTAIAKAAPLDDPEPPPSGGQIELLDPGMVAAIRIQVGELLEEWEASTESNLTLLQRRRKTGPGVSNYGFIDKVSDIAMAYPEYAHFININDLKNAIRNIEDGQKAFGFLA